MHICKLLGSSNIYNSIQLDRCINISQYGVNHLYYIQRVGTLQFDNLSCLSSNKAYSGIAPIATVNKHVSVDMEPQG